MTSPFPWVSPFPWFSRFIACPLPHGNCPRFLPTPSRSPFSQKGELFSLYSQCVLAPSMFIRNRLVSSRPMYDGCSLTRCVRTHFGHKFLKKCPKCVCTHIFKEHRMMPVDFKDILGNLETVQTLRVPPSFVQSAAAAVFRAWQSCCQFATKGRPNLANFYCPFLSSIQIFRTPDKKSRETLTL